jgi:ankyrin repeat protein
MSSREKKHSSHKKSKEYSKPNKKVQFTNDLVLLDCVKAKDVENVKNLLATLQTSNPFDINMLNESTGLSLLHHAVLEDSIDLVKLLLQSDADINCFDEDCWTPLHIAASMGYYELSK